MSKSIYEEALEIIDRNTFTLGMGFAVLTNERMIIQQALEQAHKQEKLLELYKEINNKRKELITLSRHNTWSWKLDIEIKETQDKIKELENE